MNHDANGAALLAAILACPEDDLPRLAYADLMEENGQDLRAEFIRVQIELAGLDPSKPCDGYYCDTTDDGHVLHRDCRIAHLRRREQLCLAAHNPEEWFRRGFVCHFHRGFMAEVEVVQRHWLEYGRAIVAEQPIERVKLIDKAPGFEESAIRMEFWCADSHLTSQSVVCLDPALFAALSHGSRSGNYCFYDTRKAAEADLSEACLKWAKTKTKVFYAVGVKVEFDYLPDRVMTSNGTEPERETAAVPPVRGKLRLHTTLAAGMEVHRSRADRRKKTRPS